MLSSHRIIVEEESDIGEARRTAAELARKLAASDEISGRLSLIVVEAATNLVRHAGGGEILLRRLRYDEGAGVDILALDRGPGMRSIAECLRDGFSSGGTPGTGLGAMRRLADQFEITSTPGRGTAVWCRLHLPRVGASPPTNGFATGAVNVALAGEDVSGDGWEIAGADARLRVIVADGLGHGLLAHDAARAAMEVFRKGGTQSIRDLLRTAHQELRQTRGAAVALVEIQAGNSRVSSCAVGNIALRLVREDGSQQHIISDRGTVGGNPWNSHEYSYSWTPGALLVLHSDGLSTNWNLSDNPGLQGRHPALIAGVLFRDFRRDRDDATVVVIRHQQS